MFFLSSHFIWNIQEVIAFEELFRSFLFPVVLQIIPQKAKRTFKQFIKGEYKNLKLLHTTEQKEVEEEVTKLYTLQKVVSFTLFLSSLPPSSFSQ